MKKSDLRISLRVQVAIDAISTADFAYERIVRDAARGLSEGILRRKDFIRHRPVFDGQMIQFEADAYVLTSDEFDALVKEIRDSVAMMRPIEFHPGIIDVEDKLRGAGR